MDFEATYAACFHKVFRFALSMAGNVQEAEEVAQETFFRAMKIISHLKNDAAIDAWLFRIARNVYISRLRKRKRELPEELMETLPSESSIEQQLEDRDQAARILQALHRLPEPYKEVFTLRVYGDIPYRQIAALFDKGESWARVTYYRARLMLTETIEKEQEI